MWRNFYYISENLLVTYSYPNYARWLPEQLENGPTHSKNSLHVIGWSFVYHHLSQTNFNEPYNVVKLLMSQTGEDICTKRHGNLTSCCWDRSKSWTACLRLWPSFISSECTSVKKVVYSTSFTLHFWSYWLFSEISGLRLNTIGLILESAHNSLSNFLWNKRSSDKRKKMLNELAMLPKQYL